MCDREVTTVCVTERLLQYSVTRGHYSVIERLLEAVTERSLQQSYVFYKYTVTKYFKSYSMYYSHERFQACHVYVYEMISRYA